MSHIRLSGISHSLAAILQLPDPSHRGLPPKNNGAIHTWAISFNSTKYHDGNEENNAWKMT